ncbi:MAG TPA: hypothetical protein VG325_06990 [Solirubrobacteraceae bacterium]|jgi:hypothetical protein|nr:hypothetical protein [Solirubrobacteraceae bacterium]
MTDVTRTAAFSESDSLTAILADLACPQCGCQDPGDAPRRMDGNTLRIFCVGCGAFITVLLSEGQAAAIRRQMAATSSHLT